MLVVNGINIYIAFGFILIYAIYVIIVVCQSKGENDEDADDTSANEKASALNQVLKH
jgi:Na+-transporting methylmalonyl-CoA/oxaloacetate decarboxylase gamma subunit